MPIIYVNNDTGNDSDDGSTPALAKLTLDAALTAATTGDTISIAGVGATMADSYSGTGIYESDGAGDEGVNFWTLPDKNLTITGDGDVTLTTNTNNNNIGIMWKNDTKDYEFNNLTFELTNAGVTYTYMFRNNQNAGTITFNDCTFDDGGIAHLHLIGGSGGSTSRHAYFNNCTFNYTSATHSHAIFMQTGYGTVSVTDCIFNHDTGGTGVRFVDDVTTIVFTNNTINATAGDGILFYAESESGLINNVTTTIENNDVYMTSSEALQGFRLLGGAGAGGSISFQNNTVSAVAANSIPVQFGEDGPLDDADGNPSPLGPLTFAHNQVVRPKSGSASHCLLIGFGANDGIFYNNIIEGGNIGVVIKGTGNTFYTNRIDSVRPLYFKSGQNNIIRNNSWNNLGSESIGFEQQDANGAFTGARRNPSNNQIYDNIFANSAGANVWRDRSGTTSLFSVYADRNAYQDGTGDWGIGITGTTFETFVAAWPDNDGDTGNDANSIELPEGSPFENLNGRNFTLTHATRVALCQAGLSNVGAVAYTCPTYRIIKNRLDLSSQSSPTPDDEENRFQPNETNIEIEGADEFSSIRWEIREEFAPSATMSFTTNANGIVGSPANVSSSAVNKISVNLNRAYNYYFRFFLTGIGWLAWQLLDLSGEKRTVVGRHRDNEEVTDTDSGATVRTTNPLWSETPTARGTTIVNNTYSQARSREGN